MDTPLDRNDGENYARTANEKYLFHLCRSSVPCRSDAVYSRRLDTSAVEVELHGLCKTNRSGQYAYISSQTSLRYDLLHAKCGRKWPDSFSFAVSAAGNDFRVSDPQEVKIEIDPVPDAPRFFAEFAAENMVRMYGRMEWLSCATIHGL